MLSLKLRIGIATLVIAAGAFLLLKASATKSGGAEIVRARLSDVRALPVGAPVTLAGLPVGTIVERRVGSSYAEIDIEFASKIDLREDAVLYKRRISLLSGPSLEIDPGESEKPLDGRYIMRVVESSQIGDVLYEISEALPGMHTKAAEGMVRVEQTRARVNGPLRDRLLEFDEAAQDVGKRMHERLARMDEALKVGETASFDVRGAILPALDRSDELARLARDSMSEAQAWVVRSAAETRKSVNESTEIDWSPYSDPISALDDGEGTLGTLLNSAELHDDVKEMTQDTRTFMRSLVNWQMHVGLRSEYAFNAGRPKTYITLKAGRTDRFYYIELVTSPQGGAPEVSTTYDADSDTWIRDVSIPSKLRVTAQWANRLGPITFRYGLKESSMGAGTDLQLIDSRLTLSADIFELAVADRPRVKLAASLRLFGKLYILGGLDDIFNEGRTLTADGPGTPKTLSEIYLGRDFYLGAGLEFSDRDLAALMRIGGGALTSLAL